jgi:hypothetical protein
MKTHQGRNAVLAANRFRISGPLATILGQAGNRLIAGAIAAACCISVRAMATALLARRRSIRLPAW